jgi:cyclopropane-fatty-acyl-phospholipid synthase
VQATDTPRRGASAEAIRHHYDVGNDFYALWLDPTLSYSCALWDEADTDDRLEQAQVRKLDYHAAQARAAGAARVLDVGCGWGAMLRRLVDVHGVAHATGLTLSAAQAQAVAAAGDPRVEVRLENWADHAPPAPYDAVISVGAFEHFARPEMNAAERLAAYRAFFGRCFDWLKPGGRLSLQTIAYGDARRKDGPRTAEQEFLAREIFPESEVPTLGEVLAASDGHFELVALRNDREDYQRTCRVWQFRLQARRAEARALVGDEVLKRYQRYLKLCAALFYFGDAVLLRFTFRRRDERRV